MSLSFIHPLSHPVKRLLNFDADMLNACVCVCVCVCVCALVFALTKKATKIRHAIISPENYFIFRTH